MTLKLNSRSSFNVKLNRLEDFSWTWQWWQNLIKYSIAWEFVSWSDRSKIACKRWVEKWSNRRWKRRNSISMKKQKFWSNDFVINDCVEMFQKKMHDRIDESSNNAFSSYLYKNCSSFWSNDARSSYRFEDRESFLHFELKISSFLRFEHEIFHLIVLQ
jgi:hypothetical protein